MTELRVPVWALLLTFDHDLEASASPIIKQGGGSVTSEVPSS